MGITKHIAIIACIIVILCPLKADAQAPSITNGNATIQEGAATLRGNLISGGPANVYIYWGTTDGGTNKSAWENTNSLGSLLNGAFTNSTTTNIYFGDTYYYRCYATNASGGTWASSTATFINPQMPVMDETPLSDLLVGWLEANDIDGDGDTHDNPTNGAPISTWYDKTGLGGGRNAVREGSTNPLYNKYGINNKPAVNFTSDYLSTTYNFDPYTRYTIFSVARYTGGDNERVISSASRNWLFGFHGGGNERWYAEGWIRQAGNSATNWILHAGHINNDSDPKASFYTNGNTRISNNTGSGNSNYMIGRLGLGGYRNDNEESNCEIAEVLIYSDVLDSDELDYVGGWLAWKYGLTTTYSTYTPPPLLSTSAATDLTATSAVANATLNAEMAIWHVYAYWGNNDGGTTNSNWDYTNFVGTVTNTVSTNITHFIGSLTIDSDYYYIFQAVNDATNVWSSSMPFSTLAAPSVNNTASANPGPGYAALRGELTNGTMANITIFWGTADGVTNISAWQNTNSLGVLNECSFTNNTTSNLIYGLSYYYRVYATNTAGEAWSAVKEFTTLEPESPPELPKSNMTLWMDAGKGTNMSGTSLLQWEDQSDSGNDMSISLGNAPSIVKNALNGKPAVLFNGTDDYIATTENVLNWPTTTTWMFLVSKTISEQQDSIFKMWPEQNPGRIGCHLPWGAGGSIYWDCGGTSGDARLSVGSLNTTSYHIWLFVSKDGAPNERQEIWQDGSRKANDTTAVTMGTQQKFRLGNDGGSAYWNGEIAEMIVYNTDLSSNNHQTVGGYLAWKYGLSSSYPSYTPTNTYLIGVTNICITNITATSATCQGLLGAIQSVFDVYLMWGPTDGGTVQTNWANTNFIGSYTNIASTNLSATLSTLTQGGNYYCTFLATNAAGRKWASPSMAFSTLDTPYVNNYGGAIPGVNYALMRGRHTNSWLADITIYWGTTDGGTNAASWENTNHLGTLYEGFFTNSTLTNLLYGVTYYYRCYGENLVGSDWANATTNFTTLDPGISIHNNNVLDLRTNSATFSGTLNATSSVLDVYVYWGTNNGGTAEGLWNYTNYIGSYTNDPAVALTFPTNGLAGGEEYFYTFRATNQLTSIWASPSWSFRTTHLPVIDNIAGAIPGIQYAYLRGELTDGSRADITVYWGTSDGGTSHTSWAYSIHLPEYDEGYFAPSTPTNLLYGERYYYRCFASNDAGTAWADSTADFLTEGDSGAYSINNNPATGLTTPFPTFNGTLECPDATFDVYVYWGTSDGENVSTNWAKTNLVGTYTNQASVDLTFTTNNLPPNTLYYYTFNAVNDGLDMWATPSESFISFNLSEDRIQDFDDWIPTPDSKLITGIPVTTNAEGWTAEKVYITDLFSTLFPVADSLPYACWFDDMAGASKPTLTSPFITNGGIGVVQFSHSSKTNSPQVFSVAISSDGSTWVTNGLYTNPAVSTAWITNGCAVNSFKNYYVRFNKISDGGINNQYLGLDNIIINLPDPFIVFTNLTLSPVPQTTESDTTVSFQTAIRNDMGPITASNITATLYYSTNFGVSYITNVMTKIGTTNFSFNIPAHAQLGNTIYYYASADYEMEEQTPTRAYYPANAPREYFEYEITVLYSYDRSVNFDNWTTSPLFNILNNIPTTATNRGWFADDVYIAAGGLFQMPPADSSPNMIVFDDTVAGSQPYLISTNYQHGIGTVYFSQNARSDSYTVIGFKIETSTDLVNWTTRAELTEEDNNIYTWHTNQVTINTYDNCWLRFSVTNADENGRYLCLDNIFVSHPPAEAKLDTIYYAPPYPATNDNVFVYCNMSSLHANSPVIQFLPKVVSRSKSLGIWQTNDMQKLTGNIFRGQISPRHPRGDVQFYVLGDFTGYYYVHSNGFSECLAPEINPTNAPDDYYTQTIRYRKAQQNEAFIDSNVGTFEMNLVKDYVWQGVIYNNKKTNTLSFTVEGHDTRVNYSSDTPYDITYGDTEQWRFVTPMERYFGTTPQEIIVNNAETGTQYMVEFNFNNNQYTVQRCVWQDFDNWFVHPELFADGANTREALYWETNFNGWVTNSISKLQGFQNNTNWYSYTNYNITSPFYYTEDFGWRIKHAQIEKRSGTDDLSDSGNAVQLKESPNFSPMIYITKFFRTDGAEKISFDYRASDTNVYTTIYTNDTSSWNIISNYFQIIFDGGNIQWPDKYDRTNSYISCYYMYQNPSNYFEARLETQYDSGAEKRVEYLGSIRKIVNGSRAYYSGSMQRKGPLKRWIITVGSDSRHTLTYDKNNFVSSYYIPPFTNQGTIGFAASDMDFVVSNNLIVFQGQTDSEGVPTNIVSLYYATTNNPSWEGWENVSTSSPPWILCTNTESIIRVGHIGMPEIIYGTADVDIDEDVEDYTLWDVRNYLMATNLYWKSLTYNIQTSQTVYLPIMYGSGYGNVRIDNIKTYGWHGQTNYSDSGWIAMESWVTTNDFNNSGRSIDLQMSRRLPPAEQYLMSPKLDTIGSLEFMCYTPNDKTATFELQVAEGSPTGWKTVATQSVKTNAWTTFGYSIKTNIIGYLRILHTTPNNEGWLRIDDINVTDYQLKTTNAWIGYNFLSTDRTNGLTDALQLFGEEGRTAHLNYKPDEDILGTEPLDEDVPYIISPYLKNGIGGISFWYRNWSMPGGINAGNLKIQTSARQDGPWKTVSQINTVSTLFQYFSTNLYDRTSRYVRIANENIYTEPDRVTIDNLLVTDPIGTDMTIRNVEVIPSVPLDSDEVKFRVELSEYLFGVADVVATVYYRTTESDWGQLDETNSISLPMTCIYTNDATNPPAYTYETIGSIPASTNITDTVVQYFVRVSFSGDLFANLSSPKDHKEFTNPSWYYPVDLNTNDPANTIPYYVVFSCPPGSVWINELNLGHYSPYDFTNEFIELCGIDGADIAGWKLDLLGDDGDNPEFFTSYLITNNTVFSNEKDGFGFWLLGDEEKINTDQKLTVLRGNYDTEEEHIPFDGGGLHLVRSMGAYEHRVCYNLVTPWDGYDEMINNDGWDAFINTNGSLQLYGTGTNRADFTWGFITNITDNTINSGQSFVAALVEVLITDLWLDSTNLWIRFTAPTNIIPTAWSATNLTVAEPWTKVTNSTYTNADGTFTQWFSLPTNAPAYFYKITVTN